MRDEIDWSIRFVRFYDGPVRRSLSFLFLPQLLLKTGAPRVLPLPRRNGGSSTCPKDSKRDSTSSSTARTARRGAGRLNKGHHGDMPPQSPGSRTHCSPVPGASLLLRLLLQFLLQLVQLLAQLVVQLLVQLLLQPQPCNQLSPGPKTTSAREEGPLQLLL